MLTDQEIQHIAKLARIELSDELRDKMKREMSSILEYIEVLNGVDTSGVEPLYQVTGLQNAVRPDVHRGDWPMNEELAGLLVGQAPHNEGRYVKVKAIKSK